MLINDVSENLKMLKMMMSSNVMSDDVSVYEEKSLEF